MSGFKSFDPNSVAGGGTSDNIVVGALTSQIQG